MTKARGSLSGKATWRRHFVPQTLAWSSAWLIGLSLVAGLAYHLYSQQLQRQLESEMVLYSMAVYGLTWFDEDETFHGEWLAEEPLMSEPPFDLWVARRDGETFAHDLAPDPQRFPEPDFAALEQPTLHNQEAVWIDHASPSGEPLVTYATPAFSDSQEDLPVATIAVVAPYSATRAAIHLFGARLLLGIVILGAVGIGVGAALSRWSLRPAIDALQQGERFLAGAAHELRTPLAAFRSIVDGSRSGIEPPAAAIARLDPLLRSTEDLVADLLLFARLEGGHEVVRPERFRLDLTVEECLDPESEDRVELDLPATEIVADPRLASVAIRNLIGNARQHGASADGLVIRPATGGVVVSDHGPGYAQEVLRQARAGDSRLFPSTGGSGVGLALVRLIAELHGGELRLSNRDAGGARAELILEPS